jgi:hypothetical protein
MNLLFILQMRILNHTHKHVRECEGTTKMETETKTETKKAAIERLQTKLESLKKEEEMLNNQHKTELQQLYQTEEYKAVQTARTIADKRVWACKDETRVLERTIAGKFLDTSRMDKYEHLVASYSPVNGTNIRAEVLEVISKQMKLSSLYKRQIECIVDVLIQIERGRFIPTIREMEAEIKKQDTAYGETLNKLSALTAPIYVKHQSLHEEIAKKETATRRELELVKLTPAEGATPRTKPTKVDIDIKAVAEAIYNANYLNCSCGAKATHICACGCLCCGADPCTDNCGGAVVPIADGLKSGIKPKLAGEGLKQTA